MLTIFASVFLFSSKKVQEKASAITNTYPNPDGWVTDAYTNAIVPDSDGSVFIGGQFDYVGPNTGKGAPVSRTTGLVADTFPMVEGGGAASIRAVVSDGSGGWYIGGTFTKVGGLTRNRIAHIQSDGSVNPNWNPNASSDVSSLILDGSTLYAGGNFTSIGGQSRNRIAALSTSTGLATSWNPNSNGGVTELALGSGVIYTAGSFTTIGGQSRNYIAALDLSTGLATSWDPSPDGFFSVSTIAVNGSFVYVGGSFANIGGQARTRIAQLNVSDGLATSWNPIANNEVTNLLVHSGILYVEGNFTSISSQTRNKLAAFDASTDIITSWDPNVTGFVSELAAIDTSIYIGGFFTAVGGQSRHNLAEISTTTGNATSWDPDAGNDVLALAVDANNIYVGGDLESIGGKARTNIAKFSPDGTLDTSWDPILNGQVNYMALSGDTLYVAGAFTSVDGNSVGKLIAIDADTGGWTGWNPTPTISAGFPWVDALLVDGSTLYVGGRFNGFSNTNLGAVTRNYIASFNTTNGNVNTWNPNANARVTGLSINSSNLYVSGAFTTIGGQSRTYLAALDTTTGLATSWDPGNPDDVPATLLYHNGNIYVGGPFSQIGGTDNRSKFAVFDATTAALQSFALSIDSDVNDMIVIDGILYLAGWFFEINSVEVPSIAAFDLATEELITWWQIESDGTVNALSKSGDTLYIGGDFVRLGGNDHPSYAILEASPQIQFTSTTSSNSESTTSVNISLTLSYSISENATVDYTVSGGTATGSSTDYTLANGTATVTAGNTSVNIPVTITNDAVPENDETIILTLTNPTFADLGSNTTHTYTITNDDIPGVTITQTSGSTDVTEGGTTDTYEVVLDTQPSDDVTITVSSNSQLNIDPATLTFTDANWSTPQSVTVTAVDDSTVEGDHGSSISHSSTSNDPDYEGLSIDSVDVNISDNDVVITPISTPTSSVTTPSVTATTEPTTTPTPTITITPTMTPAEEPTTTITPIDIVTPTSVVPPVPSSNNEGAGAESALAEALDKVSEFVTEEVGILGAVSFGVTFFYSLEIMALLKYLITGGFFIPLLTLLFKGGKHGKVIDDFTNEGVVLVGIRVFNRETNTLVKKVISSFSGKFYATLEPGKYRFEFDRKDYMRLNATLDLNETTKVENTVALTKLEEKDFSAQIQYRSLDVDPKTISAFGGIMLAILNFIFIQTVISLIILCIATLAFIIFIRIKFFRKKYHLI